MMKMHLMSGAVQYSSKEKRTIPGQRATLSMFMCAVRLETAVQLLVTKTVRLE